MENNYVVLFSGQGSSFRFDTGTFRDTLNDVKRWSLQEALEDAIKFEVKYDTIGAKAKVVYLPLLCSLENWDARFPFVDDEVIAKYNYLVLELQLTLN
jgi:hypothetical protein